jgi:sensor histidine kinase YesM
MNKKSFIPSDKIFWLYHGAGLLALAAIDSLTIMLAPHMAGFKLWSSWVLWPPLFTLAVLSFRWLYHRYFAFFQKPIAKLIPIMVGYATITSVIATTIITVILLPFYWQSFVPPELVASGQINLVKLGFQIVVGAALSGQLFIIAWIFIYVSIVQNRNARAQELSNEKLQTSLKEAQLATLNSQLNPHFLFNALNNIRFVIYEDARRADRMLTVLSELLRYTLNSSNQTLVPLEQELAMTQRFVDLVKLQYEDKLQFSVINKLTNQSLNLPPMSIQTLVENAVKHGLELLPKGGAINVELGDVLESSDKWQITIANPVPEGPVVQNNNGTGTGLHNIRHRISLLFGSDARLETSMHDGFFVAKLVLPKGEK